MITRFDVLLVVLIVLSIFGFPAGLVGSGRVPPYLVSVLVIVILVVLLLLGVVRY